MYENNDLNFALRVSNLKCLIVPNFVSVNTAIKLWKANFPQNHRCLYYIEYFEGTQKLYALRTIGAFALEHGYNDDIDKVIRTHKHFFAPKLQDLMNEFLQIKCEKIEFQPALMSFIDENKKRMFKAFLNTKDLDPIILKEACFVHTIPAEAMAALYLYCVDRLLINQEELLDICNFDNRKNNCL